MNKYILVAIIAILINLPNTLFSQEVIGQIQHAGKNLELVQTSLHEIHVKPEKDGYMELVKKAIKQGLALCPQDSAFLNTVSKMVRLDPSAHKFNALVATAPYTKPGEEGGFFIPSIVSLQSGESAVELYYEMVGFFYPEEFDNAFQQLNKVNILGYVDIDTGLTPYDWIFVREVQTTTP